MESLWWCWISSYLASSSQEIYSVSHVIIGSPLGGYEMRQQKVAEKVAETAKIEPAKCLHSLYVK